MSRGVLVTGASSPVGLAIVRAFAARGDRVIGVSLEPVDDPAFTAHLVTDLSQPGAAGQTVETAHKALAGFDVLVLAAAAAPIGAAASTTDEQWRLALASTLDSAFWVVRAALSGMSDTSSIVAVSSVNATIAAPSLPGYTAAKAGLEGLVRQLALQYGPAGIRVNAVAPGIIGHADLPAVTEGYPLRRVGSPEDVASAVVFLASPAASFITGVTLPVDGGLTISSAAAWLRPDLRDRFL